MANKKISELPVGTTATTGTKFEALQGGINVQVDADDLPGTAVTREFNRTFSEELIFDKNEIFHSPTVMTDDIVLTIGSGGLVDQSSAMRFRMTTDGIHSISFGSGFDYRYGISNGQILDAGTYEFYLLYTNGSVVINVPGASAESSSTTVLSTPTGFTATPGVGDPETELDLVWDDVANESSYQVEVSLNGLSGWSVLATPAAGVTGITHTGLVANDTRYYRMKSVGDGVSFVDSNYTDVISGQTESSGDVTDPDFTFLPANGNAVWPINKPIVITVDEPVRNLDASPITSNQAGIIVLKETNSGGADIAHSWTIDSAKQVFTITPTTHYGENQVVFVSINNVEDVNGNDVTVAESITFTTTDYTFLNGTSNRLQFGDILDSLWATNNTNFWLELTINNSALSGTHVIVSKYDTSGNQRCYQWYYTATDIFFGYVRFGSGLNNRVIKWAGAMTSGAHTFVLKYDGSIDTNDGLDRLTLLKDGGTVGSKTLEVNTGGAIADLVLPNVTSQLAVGMWINNAGNPVGSAYYTEEAKDFIVRSSAGSVVEINVPNLIEGTDTSGNARHGTWV